GGGAAQLGDLEDAQPVELPAVGEAEQVGVGAGHEEVLDEVLLAGLLADDPATATPLRAVGGQRQPLDVALVADRDRLLLGGDQVEAVPPGGLAGDLGPAGLAVALAKVEQVLADDLQDVALAAEQLLVAVDPAAQLVVLAEDLVALEPGQLAQLHADDGLG